MSLYMMLFIKLKLFIKKNTVDIEKDFIKFLKINRHTHIAFKVKIFVTN